MSFYTSFFCCRAGPAPSRFTPRDLAGFLRQFARIEACEGAVDILNLKFGDSIDRDAEPAVYEVPTAHPMITVVENIEWDVELTFPTLSDAANELDRFDRSVYRALIELGGASAGVCRLFERPECEENDRSLALNDWWLEVGPVESCLLDGTTMFAGWMKIGISGYGYPYPWTFADLIKKAESSSEMVAVRALCREAWPASQKPISQEVIDARKTAGEL
jgi:hypothetical protein